MIRPLTSLCLIAACGSGLYLYAEKHRAELLDREIAHVIRATEAARERSGMLRAEWALLNEPGRLQDLSSRFLHLQPMVPTQFVRLADLGNHLPPPEAAAPAGSTDDDDAAPDAAPPPAASAPDIASLPPAPETHSAEARAPEPHEAGPPAPPPAAHLAQKTKPAAHQTRLAAAHDPAHPHHTAIADALTGHEGPLTRGAPLALAAPQPMSAPLVSAMARPMRPAPSRTVIAATPAYAGAYVRSAIGGTGTLPPPVPLDPAER